MTDLSFHRGVRGPALAVAALTMLLAGRGTDGAGGASVRPAKPGPPRMEPLGRSDGSVCDGSAKAPDRRSRRAVLAAYLDGLQRGCERGVLSLVRGGESPRSGFARKSVTYQLRARC